MPDLVLLDVQLPGQEDGFALARWLRESNTKVGIIMLTAAGDAVDKVLGLESGADDYVAKPSSRASFWRAARACCAARSTSSTPSLLERIRMGQYMLEPAKRQLLDPVGKDVALTSGEFDILKTFAENPNRPLSRDWLLETTATGAAIRSTAPSISASPASGARSSPPRQADRNSHRARRRLYVRAARRIG